jgi:hypothetical protein
MKRGRSASRVDELPSWARKIYEERGSPKIDEIEDIFHGPLMDRKYGLRKDDLIEIVIDNRALPKGEETRVRGMLIGTSRSSVDILDRSGDFRSIARDIIVEIKLVIHLRKTYLEDEELLTFEKEDMRRRSNVHEQAEKLAEGQKDSHIWD